MDLILANANVITMDSRRSRASAVAVKWDKIFRVGAKQEIASLATSGTRIIDLTHMLSGPYGAMMLADLGAEAIKVEPPKTGEGTRRLLERNPANSLNGFGAYYMTLNRNKKSVTLDLKSERGLEIFYELVKTADVVINNFSVGVTERLKIDYAHLSQINPRIITCTITGFGETGPGKDRTAFDMVAQAMGGEAGADYDQTAVFASEQMPAKSLHHEGVEIMERAVERG